MLMKDFMELYKSSKQSTCYTGSGSFVNRPVRVDSARKFFMIRHVSGCSHCNRTKHELVFIKFKNPRRLIVFECDMLYALRKGLRPADYAYYHKCLAGKRFIGDIVFWSEIKEIEA